MTVILLGVYKVPFMTAVLGSYVWRGRSHHETFALPVRVVVPAIQVGAAARPAGNDNG